ncbi:2Fe-2S iron-sulfur cluster-binding protein [Arenibacterium sp. LLYu02]|uniref:2Fe-2S iron-sulfur cluster-binding protein n=1 Tax=Arenibacterium sp. LLYu02 TaxID=3404132 RepID=UPI003B216E81
MTVITFAGPSGERQEFVTEETTTAMTVARLNGVSGIEAECGGSLSCATCHVYVAESDLHKLPPASEDELEMLELVAAERRPTSRLCCQIVLGDNVDSLVLELPETQF